MGKWDWYDTFNINSCSYFIIEQKIKKKMAKYSPKENTYKEMYLINKFEKDIMENSLQNMRNDQNKTTQKIITTNDISSVKEKEEIENSNKKKTKTKYLMKRVSRISLKFLIQVLKRNK